APDTFIGCKEEGALENQRATEGAAELVAAKDRPGQKRIVKEVSRVSGFVAEVFENVAMEGALAGLCDEIDNAPSGVRELGRSQRGLDAKLLNGFEGRVNRHREYVPVGIGSAIQEKRVHRGAKSVNGRVQRDCASVHLNIINDVVRESSILARYCAR